MEAPNDEDRDFATRERRGAEGVRARPRPQRVFATSPAAARVVAAAAALIGQTSSLAGLMDRCLSLSLARFNTTV